MKKKKKGLRQSWMRIPAAKRHTYVYLILVLFALAVHAYHRVFG